MLLRPRCLGSQSGTAFLEIIIAIGVLAALVGGIATLVVASYDLVGYSRTRVVARHLAQEKMELIRNLPYTEVAVIGGVPAGNLPQLETLVRNGAAYTVRTNVVYVDDPFDNLAPVDTLPIDYKRARVDVSWTGTFASNSTITLITDVAPKGIETLASGGTLSILVFDAQAQPVAEAQVRVQNTLVTPTIDLMVNTDVSGRVILPGSPVCFECYSISVTKDSYSSDRTYAASEVAHPEKPPATVNNQSLTEISFAIDRLSTLTVRSTQGRSTNYTTLANQFFNLRGNKVIGTNTEGEPVYKYDQLLQTNGSGLATVTNLEWDTYTITVPAESWDFAGSNPLSPFVLLPGASLSLAFVSVPHEDNSVLFQLKEASGSAIAAAPVHLTKGGYDEILLSGNSDKPDFGQAFFSPLSPGTYDVEATKSGYLTNFFQVTAGGEVQETIILNQP